MGLEVKIYDTPAGGIRASQGTFSSFQYLCMKTGSVYSFKSNVYPHVLSSDENQKKR